MLFVLVGAAVDIRYTMQAGAGAVLLIALALVIRSVGVCLCVAGTKLTKKERLFCVIAYLPKATVQAAIGALSAATWAVFSVIIVSVVNPFVKNYIYMIPLTMADAAAAVLVGFAVVDTGFAVRRALDLRALLESMERYAKELQALHGGLDSINEHVSGMIRDFAAHVDSKQEEFAANAKRVTAARDRVREMMDQKRLSLEDGAKERFANFERILNEAASYLPDVSTLRKEVEEAKAKYDRQSEELRKTRERRLLRAEHALRNNPTAASRRHKGPFEQLKRIQQRDEEKKHSA